MSDQDTPDNENVVAFRRKPKGEKSEKRARAVAPNPNLNQNLNINSSATLEPGDNVMCRIVRYVPGGFNVIVIPQNLHAYLPSNSNHQAGDEISAIFVKAEKDRLLLSQRPAAEPRTKAPANSSEDWPIPGENLVCKIVRVDVGGYEVIVPKYDSRAYMPSNAQHKAGDDVLAIYVCMDKGRMLLSERLTPGQGDLIKLTSRDDDEDA